MLLILSALILLATLTNLLWPTQRIRAALTRNLT
jgi:hypothetical protein